MPEAGLLIHPNTDDPPCTASPAALQADVVDSFGFDLDEIRRFMLNVVLGAFVPEEEKRGLATVFAAEYDRLRTELEDAA